MMIAQSQIMNINRKVRTVIADVSFIPSNGMKKGIISSLLSAKKPAAENSVNTVIIVYRCVSVS